MVDNKGEKVDDSTMRESMDFLLKECREQEKMRRIRRNYRPAKLDIARVLEGKKPNKPFVSENDFKFWN